MHLLHVLIISSLVHKIAASTAASCSSDFKYFQRLQQTVLKEGGIVFMFVSVDQDSYQRSISLKDAEFDVGMLKTCQELMPNFLTHHDSKVSHKTLIDVQGFTFRGHFAEGGFIFEGIYKEMMGRNHVYVYSRADQVKTNQFLMYEACRLQLGEESKITVKHSTVLIVETTANETKNFLEELKAKIEKIALKKFKYAEFEAEGLEMCDSVEFYIRNCVATAEFNLQTYLTALVGLTCCMVFIFSIRKMGMFIRNRSSIRVHPF